jgi:hypothetical protein
LKPQRLPFLSGPGYPSGRRLLSDTKSGNYLLQFAGNIVLPVKLGFVENGIENILSQNVLQHHFPHIFQRYGCIDASLAQLQELAAFIDKLLAAFS